PANRAAVNRNRSRPSLSQRKVKPKNPFFPEPLRNKSRQFGPCLPRKASRSARASSRGASSRANVWRIGFPNCCRSWRPSVRRRPKTAGVIFTSDRTVTVPKIEKQADMYLSTLRNYVEAVGGDLELLVRFPE